ncbi:MAG TPA: hypothetical protein VKO18_16830 [Terriglobia bacterium]|nr:hypothetical protein [Terriglobia bacterium]
MKGPPENLADLPLEKRALLALRAAVKKAIAERIREGLPVYIWSDGRVVDISARRLNIPPRRPSLRASGARKAR